jgi:hypothetical protein
MVVELSVEACTETNRGSFLDETQDLSETT